jgi:hypothetical protein
MVYGSDTFFRHSQRVLKFSPDKHPTKREFLGTPLFLRNRLLVSVHCGPAIRMPEQLLGSFDVDSFLAQHRSQAMADFSNGCRCMKGKTELTLAGDGGRLLPVNGKLRR